MFHPSALVNMLNRILALSALFTLMLLSFLQAHPVAWTSFSYEDARVQAMAEYRPLLAYIYHEGSPLAEKFDSQTWNDTAIVSLLNQSFVCNKTEASKMPLSGELHELQTPTEVPFILIYHPEGHIMGRVEGFVAPQTLQSILNRHLKGIPPPTRPALAMNYRGEESSLSANALVAHGRTRGMNPNCDDIPGLEKMGLEEQIGTTVDPSHFILVVAAHEEVKHIAKDLRKIKKFWRGEIFAFQYKRSDERKPKFIIALGSFDNRSTANTFADTLQEHEKMACQTVQVSRLMQ